MIKILISTGVQWQSQIHSSLTSHHLIALPFGREKRGWLTPEDMPKPSETIRNLVGPIAQQRLARQKKDAAESGLPVVLLMKASDEQRVLNHLRQDPMTWVMAMLTYLDSQAPQEGDQTNADANKSSIVQP